MLDRTVAPPSGEIAFTELPEVHQRLLHSVAPVYWLSAGDQPVFKIELVFASGIWFEPQKAVSWLTAKMLAEGTRHKSSQQIMEGFERLGAFLEINPGFDDISISVYGLKRNFDQVIVLLNEVLNDSNLPEKEFEILKSNRKDQILLNDNKSNLYASKKLREAIYGPVFPYGQGLRSGDIAEVNLHTIKTYYKDYLFRDPKIYLSGDLDETFMDVLEASLSIPGTAAGESEKVEAGSKERKIYVEKKGSLQSSIRLGWLIPNRSDKDYFNYEITNGLLGGYFGSRLMKNIREEKGYTYGIHAYPVHLRHSSFGMIAADVIADHTQDTFREIGLEIDKLLNEKISREEIETLTNYLAGSFLASINTPFQVMAKFKKTAEAGLDISYYHKYFEALKSIQEEDIKSSIDKYFKFDNAYTSIVGLNN